MSVLPSMVHRSGDSLIVRSVVSGDALFSDSTLTQAVDNAAEDNSCSDEFNINLLTKNNTLNNNINNNFKELPECKVKRNYSCATCDFFTQNPRHYLYHLRDVHEEKVRIYECPNCLYASKHFQKLLRHTKMVHSGANSNGLIHDDSEEHPQQTTTRVRTRKNSSLQSTTTNNHHNDDLINDIDDTVTNDVTDELPTNRTNNNNNNNNNGGVFKCSVCSYQARTRSLLSRHEREEHIKTRFFRCTKCSYVTHIKARFTKHVKYHSMPMIKCDMCDFRTPYKWNLDRHCKNHNGKGAFKCSACNFTADIKQSLTVHEMNHHIPPVGQAAGLGVGRRRNKVGASDATAAEDAARHHDQTSAANQQGDLDEPPVARAPSKAPPTKKQKLLPVTSSTHSPEQGSFGPDFIHPDDIIHHANGNVYIKNKCKLCNYKSAWGSEMAKHEKKVHNIIRETSPKPVKKTIKPIPNLIPIPTQTSVLKLPKKLKTSESEEPVMSQQDFKEICAKSRNSALKDFAPLCGSEDVFKDLGQDARNHPDARNHQETASKIPDLIPATFGTSATAAAAASLMPILKSDISGGKAKNQSCFYRLEQLMSGAESMICKICGHESKCLTEQAKHRESCGKEIGGTKVAPPTFINKSSRCPYCRQRCKTSTVLVDHLKTCPEALKVFIKNDDESEGELRIDESQSEDGDSTITTATITKPHPMENRVFVWNNIEVPMDLDIEEQKYEPAEDNISLDLSTRTQSPGAGSESSFIGHDFLGTTTSTPQFNQQKQQPQQHHHHQQHRTNTSPTITTDKIPTHGNDISVAQHKRVFKCPHCSFWASTASRFHVHIVGHLNKKPFECSLCSYRSNWRWDITKHIKLKSVRDPAHESAKVLMTDETGRRNYTKYNKYLTEIHVSGDQSMETSGGSGTRPKHHDHRTNPSPNQNTKNNNNNNSNNSDLPKLTRAPTGNDFSPLLRQSPLRPPPPLKAADGSFFDKVAEKKRSSAENKKILFKCKKCDFRDASRDILLAHVKGHYPPHNNNNTNNNNNNRSTSSSSCSTQELSIRGASPDKDEASVSTLAKGSQAPFRCGHCNQVSNWKHVIQRHCRLKHSGDICVVSNKNGQEKIEVEEQMDEPDHIDVPQDGTFKCNQCPYSTEISNDLTTHLLGHTANSDSITKCFYCNYFVNKREDILDHLRLHGISDPEEFYNKILERPNNSLDCSDLNKRFKCLICPYVTNSKSQYTYHKQFHKPRGGQYTCSHCSYNVSKRHLLHQHLKVHGINITPHKQNGDVIDLDDFTDEIEEVASGSGTFESQHFPDIPLVWVSKNGKFSKMFKCRFCPHVNLRKVNIQEHEKMHSVREKNPNSSRSNEVEHKCTECNYICNNAGVLSSHSKVHQGLYGTVHCLVDQSKTDDEQIRELSKFISPSAGIGESEEYENAEAVGLGEGEDHGDETSSILFFCKECPARFLKETEFSIHARLHGVRLFYKCKYCTYSARQKPHLLAHSKVHTLEYQDRTRQLQQIHQSANNPPVTVSMSDGVWVVYDEAASLIKEPEKVQRQSVPLSGTELFQQKSEAQQKLSKEPSPPAVTTRSDPQFGTLIQGNPKFVYPTYLKNGRKKEKRYKCHKCPSAFEKREQYKVHLNLHGSKQRYRCEHCDYSVKYYANYVQHIKKHKISLEAASLLRRSSDDNDLETEEITEEVDTNNKNQQQWKLSTSDQQTYNILQQRLINNQTSPTKDSVGCEEKKQFYCTNCPYTNHRKDAVENHQKRHVSISGTKSNFTCEHCDYSVPQAHHLRDHTKLHFLPNKNGHQLDAYMICNDLKLVSNSNSNEVEGDDDAVGNNDGSKDVIFEEKNQGKQFSPPLGDEVVERFNNNIGEKQFVNVETGEVKESNGDNNKKSSVLDSEKMEES